MGEVIPFPKKSTRTKRLYRECPDCGVVNLKWKFERLPIIDNSCINCGKNLLEETS